jgi:hypothetical protein
MFKRVNQLGDRLLEMVVPKVSASADPCPCAGRTGDRTQVNCYCNAGAGSIGEWIKSTWQCDGCQWRMTQGCHNVHITCVR